MSSTPTTNEASLGWRAAILEHFTPEIAKVARLTVVSDPDQLLSEERVLSSLRARVFELVPFEDPVAFRFVYESQYRQAWDRGEGDNLVVVPRGTDDDLDDLPFDVLVAARRHGRGLTLKLAIRFPRLDPTVVSELETVDLDVLHGAAGDGSVTRLGADETKDFILRHVFKIAPETISKPADLLRILLRRHYRDQSFPASLDHRFVQLLRRRPEWNEWPLEEIVPERAAFLGFVDERWPRFLERVVGSSGASAGESSATGLAYAGPPDLPFDHDDVKVYIDNLFLEGQLTSVEGYRSDDVPESWMRAGVAASNDQGAEELVRRLVGRLEAELPGPEARHRDWIDYTRVWAEWMALRWVDGEPGGQASEGLHDRIESRFAQWMLGRYSYLHNSASHHHPAMVHHIANHMARRYESGPSSTRQALVVVDGLAFDQWVVLRRELNKQLGPDVRFEEDGTFAWVPTLTGVSRQAIFAGAEPMYFGDSLDSTSKEPAHWQRFWGDRGVAKIGVAYVKEKRDQPDAAMLEAILEAAEHPKVRVLGVVISKVDQSMHGVKTGTRGLQAVVREWARSGMMAELVRKLLEGGYEIVITSDHGNIHGEGMGKPDVGAIADGRGERAHVFPDERTRSKVAGEYPGSIEWPSIGLPDGWCALLAPGRKVFVQEGRQSVAHGGIAMEEVIVPFVKIVPGGSR